MFIKSFDERKFRELILYIADASRADPRFGAVKLNKVLFYSDFTAYQWLGEPITAAAYRKLNEGPAPFEMLAQRRILLDSGDVEVEYQRYFSGVQHRIVPHRPALKELFTVEELEIVDQVIQGMWHMTALEASDFSHRELGWASGEGG